MNMARMRILGGGWRREEEEIRFRFRCRSTILSLLREGEDPEEGVERERKRESEFDLLRYN